MVSTKGLANGGLLTKYSGGGIKAPPLQITSSTDRLALGPFTFRIDRTIAYLPDPRHRYFSSFSAALVQEFSVF